MANSLVENAGRGLADFSTLRSMSAEDLVEIALTLHRLVETRSEGLDLFERPLAIDGPCQAKLTPILDAWRDASANSVHASHQNHEPCCEQTAKQVTQESHR